THGEELEVGHRQRLGRRAAPVGARGQVPMTPRGRLVAVLAAALAVVVLVVVFVVNRGAEDVPGPGPVGAVVIARRGDSLSGIANTLVVAGVVASDQAFLDAAGANPKSQSMGPGRYSMLQGMSGEGALALMLDPKARADSRLVLPEGLRLSQSLD